MSQPVAHCPFLNRLDARCSEFFSLDRLQHAYKFCFDRYGDCPRYQMMLSERQQRRGDAERSPAPDDLRDDHRALVQISLPARRKKRLVA